MMHKTENLRLNSTYMVKGKFDITKLFDIPDRWLHTGQRMLTNIVSIKCHNVSVGDNTDFSSNNTCDEEQPLGFIALIFPHLQNLR